MFDAAVASLFAVMLLVFSVAFLHRVLAMLSCVLLSGLMLTAVVGVVVAGFSSCNGFFCLGFVRMPFFRALPSPLPLLS